MLSKVGIAVLVSGGGTNLQALIDAQKREELTSGEIRVVISSKPDAYALERAAANGIPCVVVSRKACASQEDFEAAIIRTLEEYDVSLIVLAGFMSILSENFTAKYPQIAAPMAITA